MNKFRIAILVLLIIIIALLLIIIIQNIDLSSGIAEDSDGELILYKMVYENDEDVLKEEKVIVKNGNNLLPKIDVIKEHVESVLFDNNNLDYTYMKDQNRLIINFVDKDAEDIIESKWYNYFQGTTGAGITYVTLTYNFLQPEYSGEWIEELVFKFNDEDFPPLDHILLSRIFTRATLKK